MLIYERETLMFFEGRLVIEHKSILLLSYSFTLFCWPIRFIVCSFMREGWASSCSNRPGISPYTKRAGISKGLVSWATYDLAMVEMRHKCCIVRAAAIECALGWCSRSCARPIGSAHGSISHSCRDGNGACHVRVYCLADPNPTLLALPLP